MQLTLLDIVQDILSEMDSDEVNSISDTIESLQVAQVVKTTYLSMCSNRDWGDEKKLITLEHIGDLSKPNYLMLPTNLKKLEFFEYDIHKDNPQVGALNDYRRLQYRYPDEFLRICDSRPRNNDNYIEVVDFGGSKLFIKDNSPPQYWTSFDDKYIICDSYDADVDDTLQASKTRAFVVMGPEFIMEDSFIPRLPVQGYIALQEDAKSRAFLALKQMENAKAESTAIKQQRWLSRHNQRHNQEIRYVAYGRGRRK